MTDRELAVDDWKVGADPAPLLVNTCQDAHVATVVITQEESHVGISQSVQLANLARAIAQSAIAVAFPVLVTGHVRFALVASLPLSF